MELQKTFFDCTVKEISQGYAFNKNHNKYICLLCEKVFRVGEIYKIDSKYYDAEAAVKIHISKNHDGMFKNLISLDKKITGLTEQQKKVLSFIYEGYSDKEIVNAIPEINSESTIRAYRFKLREKEKQAKVFTAIMANMNRNTGFMSIHRTAKWVDDRYMITDEDVKKVTKSYYDELGHLQSWPVKEKKRLVITQKFSYLFETGKIYTEKEVNAIISEVYEDYALIRRYLIAYGFLNRKNDGSKYWKETL